MATRVVDLAAARPVVQAATLAAVQVEVQAGVLAPGLEAVLRADLMVAPQVVPAVPLALVQVAEAPAAVRVTAVLADLVVAPAEVLEEVPEEVPAAAQAVATGRPQAGLRTAFRATQRPGIPALLRDLHREAVMRANSLLALRRKIHRRARRTPGATRRFEAGFIRWEFGFPYYSQVCC